MKRPIFLLLVIIIVLTLAVPSRTQAQTPVVPTWNSSIFYYNPTANPGELQVTYFDATGATAGTSQNIAVRAHGSGEIFVGETSAAATTSSAVLASSVPMMAVYEQSRSLQDPNYGRLLYTAFDQDQGDDTLYVPDFVFDTKGYQTRVGVQNVDVNGPTDVNLAFFNSSGNEVTVTNSSTTGLPYNASWVFNKADILFPGDSFNGSLVINAPGGSRQIVAAVEQWQADGRRDYAFEAVPAKETSSKVFMSSMQCRYSRGGQTTYYIIQNAGDANTTVTVRAYDEAKRVAIGTGPTTVPVGVGTTLMPSQKVVFSACSIPGTAFKSGSAVIESSNGEELAVIGKVIGSDGLTTTFSGKNAGHTRVILPYVVWVSNILKGYRTTISVMNVGGGNATNVHAKYYQLDGTLLKDIRLTPTNKPLLPNFRISTNPSSAKALRSDNSFRGAVEIESDQPVIVVVRMERKISGVKGYTMLGEDYTGVPYVETGP